MGIRSLKSNLTRFMKRMMSTRSSVGTITKYLWSGTMSLDAVSPVMTVDILLVTMLILVTVLLSMLLVKTQSLSCTRVTTVCMPSSGPVMLTSMLMVIMIIVTSFWATGSVAVTVLLLPITMWAMARSMTSGRTIPMDMARCWTTLLKLATSYPLATRSFTQSSHTSTAMTTATSPSPRSPMPSTRELRSTDFDVFYVTDFMMS